MTFLRVAARLALLACVAVALAACEATDTASQVKTGVDTAGYLASVQPQLEAYGTTLGNLDTSGALTTAKAASFTTAQEKLEAMAAELKSIEADVDYRDAHEKLIMSVENTSQVLGDLAAAAKDNDRAAYDAALTAFAKGQRSFASAMEAVTKPLLDASGQ